MASCLAVCPHGLATLPVVALRRRCARSSVVMGSVGSSPSGFLLCGWARRQTVAALRWGGQLWCLPSPPVGEFAEQSVRILLI